MCFAVLHKHRWFIWHAIMPTPEQRTQDGGCYYKWNDHQCSWFNWERWSGFDERGIATAEWTDSTSYSLPSRPKWIHLVVCSRWCRPWQGGLFRNDATRLGPSQWPWELCSRDALTDQFSRSSCAVDCTDQSRNQCLALIQYRSYLCPAYCYSKFQSLSWSGECYAKRTLPTASKEWTAY